jgi:hypothetical protein
MRDSEHPVREIVLPLVVVLGLIGNALIIGVAWGRFSQRMDTYESGQVEVKEKNRQQDEKIESQRDRLRDLERDAIEDRKTFNLFEDYARGRIDRLPYHPPPSRR